MRKLGKWVWPVLLALCLAACSDEAGLPEGLQAGEWPQTLPELLAEDIAALPEGEQAAVEMTPELKGLFFDWGSERRWDFLPSFARGEQTNQASDYLYLIMADALVWSDQYNIDKEKTPDALSADWVTEYIQQHFAVEAVEPPVGTVWKFGEFDGEQYTPSPGEWAYPPCYELVDLTLSKEGEDVVYTALLWEYAAADGSAEMPADTRAMLVEGRSSGIAPRNQQELSFSLAGGDLLYLANHTESVEYQK